MKLVLLVLAALVACAAAQSPPAVSAPPVFSPPSAPSPPTDVVAPPPEECTDDEMDVTGDESITADSNVATTYVVKDICDDTEVDIDMFSTDADCEDLVDLSELDDVQTLSDESSAAGSLFDNTWTFEYEPNCRKAKRARRAVQATLVINLLNTQSVVNSDSFIFADDVPTDEPTIDPTNPSNPTDDTTNFISFTFSAANGINMPVVASLAVAAVVALVF